MPTTAFLSFRLNGADGVSIEAAKWRHALEHLGHTTYAVAGSGPVDVTIPGLAMGADEGPDQGSDLDQLAQALVRADLVVVENLLSLPLNEAAWQAVAEVLADRPALLHHHDLPWQRPQFIDHAPPPDRPDWRHVTINERSRLELADRGIAARTVYNSFAVPDPAHDRPWPDRSAMGEAVRASLGVGPGDRLVLQPTRALERKNVAGGLRATAALHGTYWLLGPAEDGFGPELDRLLADAPCPVVRGLPDAGTAADSSIGATSGLRQHRPPTIDDAYDACDVVVLPSTWEGFGNPSLESVTHRRPLVIGPYPVADELAAFGFTWFPLDGLAALDEWLLRPDAGMLEDNLAVARAHFSLADLPGRLTEVLEGL